MRKLVSFFQLVFLTSIATAQIQMNSSGRVGIGCAPDASYRLKVNPGGAYFVSNSRFDNGAFFYSSYSDLIIEVQGYGYNMRPEADNYCWLGRSDKAYNYMWSYNYYNPSDLRKKENIKDITNALDIILKLKGIKYDLKKEYAFDYLVNDEQFEKERNNRIGFIAQDVSKVLPEAVIYDDSTDTYGIDYMKIIPVLVEAIKEQQLIIENLQSEMTESKLKSTSNSLKSDNSTEAYKAKLYQNIPNPFTEITKIEYFLDEEITTAHIFIYDMHGTQLKNFLLHHKGYGNVTINGGELKAGMYMYTLIADNKVIDTKRMVLTD